MRHDGEIARVNADTICIKYSVMDRTKHKTISRVVCPISMLGYYMRSFKGYRYIEITECTNRAMDFEEFIPEAVLSLTFLHFAQMSLQPFCKSPEVDLLIKRICSLGS